MPNWCTNTLQIKGQIKDLDDMVNKLDEFEKPAGWGPALLEVFVPIGKWDYDKALKAWGTKWDVEYHVLSGIETEDGQMILTLGFDSAWGPPIEGILTWSKSYPEAMFRIAWSETGCAQWGVSIIQDGETERSEGGEIPDFSSLSSLTEIEYDNDKQYAFVEAAMQSLTFV